MFCYLWQPICINELKQYYGVKANFRFLNSLFSKEQYEYNDYMNVFTNPKLYIYPWLIMQLSDFKSTMHKMQRSH